jgi:hypothetical protein
VAFAAYSARRGVAPRRQFDRSSPAGVTINAIVAGYGVSSIKAT